MTTSTNTTEAPQPVVTRRPQGAPPMPEASRALQALAEEVTKAAIGTGLERRLLELVKVRASQINGCAVCLNMHSTDAVKQGEDPQRLFLLDAWRKTAVFTEQERAALELTEALTRLPQTQGIPDDVYQRATKALDQAQYPAVVWMVVVINGFNRVTTLFS
jgi:AhpD family alkylhydroperoxidase